MTALEWLQDTLSLPTSVVITGIASMMVLDQAFQAAKTYQSLGNSGIQLILAKTATAAADGRYKPFKTSPIFDFTAAHPEWLGYNAQA